MEAAKQRRYLDLPTDLESALDLIEKLLDEQKQAERFARDADREREVAMAMITDARAALNAVEAPAGTPVRHPVNYQEILKEEK
jgi:hypothetical protein